MARTHDSLLLHRLVTPGLFALLTLVLAVQHGSAYVGAASLVHLPELVRAFEQIMGGQVFVHGPVPWDAHLPVSGPAYYWLSLPAWLADDPARGIHTWYFGLELICLAVWVFWGLRVIQPSGAVWVSAFLLAIYPENRVIYCENLTLAAYLAAPAFMACAAALRSTGLRTVALAGVLLGLAFAVHPLAVTLLPAAMLALLVRRPRPIASASVLAAAFVGVAVAFPMVALVAQGLEHDIDLGTTVDSARAYLTPGSLARGLIDYFEYPLALVAAGGVAAFTWRKRESRPLALLALTWVGFVYVTIITYMVTMGGVSGQFHRMGLANPGRALLVALALTWTVDLLRERAGRWIGAALDLRLWVVLGCAVTAIVVGNDLLDTARQRSATLDQVLRSGCTCDALDDLGSLEMSRIAEAIATAGVVDPRGACGDIRGIDGDILQAAYRWATEHSDDLGSPRHSEDEDRPNQVSVIAPAMAGRDLPSSMKVQDHGFFWLYPDAHALEVDPAGRDGSFTLRIPMWARDREFVLLGLRRTLPDGTELDEANEHLARFNRMLWACFDPPVGETWVDVVWGYHDVPGDNDYNPWSFETSLPALVVNGVEVHPTHRCEHYAAADDGAGVVELGRHFDGWYLFDLSALQSRPDTLRLLSFPGIGPITWLEAYGLGGPPPLRPQDLPDGPIEEHLPHQ